MDELIQEIVVKRGGKIIIERGEFGPMIQVDCESHGKRIGQVFKCGEILQMAKYPDEILIFECQRIARNVVRLDGKTGD